jgi:hypothetical protein
VISATVVAKSGKPPGIATDEGRSGAIANQCIVLDGQRTIRAYGCQRHTPRRLRSS